MSSQSSQAGMHYLLDDLVCSIHKITVNIGGLEKRINWLVFLFHSLHKLLRLGI